MLGTKSRVTPKRPVVAPLNALALSREQRQRVHMAAAVLLDYPDAAWFAKLPTVRSLIATVPEPVRAPLEEFMDAAVQASVSHSVLAARGRAERDRVPALAERGRAEHDRVEASLLGSLWEQRYVTTFDLKRKCSLYLTYYATGDTRKRGTALVTILEAYRAAGWEFDADELPDYLPAVLEFSAMSDSEIAAGLLSSHREGIEVLRAALEAMDSPWAGVVRAVTLSLPPIDEATRERYLALISEGPPTETVGLSFLGIPGFPAEPGTGGNLPPFSAREHA